MENLLQIFQDLSFGYARLDEMQRVIEINTRFSRIIERERGQVLDLNIHNILPDIKVFTFNKTYECNKISRDNGQILSIDLLKFKNGKSKEYLLFCRDSTKYQELSDQVSLLTEQLSLFTQMFNVIYDGIFITNNHGVTLFVNDAFLNLSGLQRKDVVGKSVYYLMEKNIVPHSCSAVVLRTKEPASTINNYYNGKSCLVSGTPVFEGDELIRVVCIIRDVSELDSLRNKLENVTSLTLSYKHQLKEIEVKNTNKNIIQTRSKLMKNVYNKAIKVASVDSPVLLLGETGVGKDFLANFIHEIGEGRSEGHFIKVNCGAIPEQLLESELFGYEPGSFTGANKHGKAGLFELANNGTLFLDEIGDIPLHLQVKLLNALQDKKIYRVGGTKTVELQSRIIAATNADLEELIKNGTFRKDLYYRLNVININIPPLRERRDDIMPLAIRFLEQFNKQYFKTRYFSPKTMELILSYNWPGNIREMKNTIERLVIISDSDCIDPKSFEDNILNNVKYTDTLDLFNINSRFNGIIHDTRPLKARLEEYEAGCIKEAIDSTETLKDAAKLLRIDISTLVRKRQKFSMNN